MDRCAVFPCNATWALAHAAEFQQRTKGHSGSAALTARRASQKRNKPASRVRRGLAVEAGDARYWMSIVSASLALSTPSVSQPVGLNQAYCAYTVTPDTGGSGTVVSP